MVLFEIPGSFNPEDLLSVAEEIEPILQDIHKEHNIRYLFPFQHDYAALASAKPVASPEDLMGLRTREYGPWVGDSLEEWGAVPMTIPPPDLTTSLERATVDAAYGSWAFLRAFRTYEQAPHFSWLGYQTMWGYLMMNENIWNELTPEQQAIFEEAGAEAARHNNDLVVSERKEFQSFIEAEGGSNHFFSEEDRIILSEKIQPIFDKYRDSTSPLGKELLNKLEGLKNK